MSLWYAPSDASDATYLNGIELINQMHNPYSGSGGEQQHFDNYLSKLQTICTEDNVKSALQQGFVRT